MARQQLMQFIDERKGQVMLEIGPFMNPAIRKEVHNVYYADIRSKDEIYNFYLKHNLCTPEELYERIAPIDFVIKDTYEKAMDGKKFNVIFSSHVIEHVNDIIFHLQDLAAILNDDGYLVMAIPDKRYCFDHFREVTPFRDMLDVYLNGSVNSTARLAFDGFNGHRCNDPEAYHSNSVSFSSMIDSGIDDYYWTYLNQYKSVRDKEMVLSEHNWVFTCTSFLDCLRDMLRANMLPFSCFYFDTTPENIFEFTIILQKNISIMNDKEKRIDEIQKIINMSEQNSEVSCFIQKTELLQAGHNAIQKSLQDEINALNCKISAYESNINHLKEEHATERNILLAEKDNQYHAFINSNSWKITAPFRAITRIFRRVGL